MPELFAHWTANPAIYSFMVAIAVLFLLLMLELLFLTAGISAAEPLNTLLRKEPLAAHPLLRWLGYPGMPASLSIVAVLATYGTSGLLLQTAALSIQNQALPWPYAVPLPGVLALLAPRGLGLALASFGLLSEVETAERSEVLEK